MPPNPHIPKEIADLLKATPEVTEADLQRLTDACEKIKKDPLADAELQQSMFVHYIQAAMQAQQLTQAEVARAMRRSPQYLCRVLNEENPANFTATTMSIISHAVNRRCEIVVLAEDEIVKIERAPAFAASSGSKPKQLRLSLEWSQSIEPPTKPSNVIEYDPALFTRRLMTANLNQANEEVAVTG